MIIPNYFEDLHILRKGTQPDHAYFIPASRRMDDLVEQRETSFVVTNARNGENFDEPSVPQTGDTSRILLYVLVMNAAGIMLVILGLMRKRSQR